MSITANSEENSQTKQSLAPETLEKLKAIFLERFKFYYDELKQEKIKNGQRITWRTVRLHRADYRADKEIQWFGLLAPCPICGNDNESGYCTVGIKTKKPFEITFRCRRYAKTAYQLDSKTGKKCVVLNMGKDSKGNKITDVYYWTGVFGTTAYWSRNNKLSKSDLISDKYADVNIKVDPQPELLAPETKPEYEDIMYQFVLSKYKLSDQHLANLKHRGFTIDDLKSFRPNTGFGSIDSKRMVYQYGGHAYTNKGNVPFSLWDRALQINKKALMAKSIPPKKVDILWFGVPGFYFKNVEDKKKKQIEKVPYFKDSTKGMLVPFFDYDNRLIRFQIRVDEPMLKHQSVEAVENQGFDWQKDGRSIKVVFPQDYWGRKYKIIVIAKSDKSVKKVVIAKGRIHHLHDWIDITPQLRKAGFKEGSYKFKVNAKEGNKYYWLSSNKFASRSGLDIISKYQGYFGVEPVVGTPVEVAYQPKIARLQPDSPELKAYQQKPKAVWLTEGGLKALLAVRKLSNHFSDKELDVLGHDVLGVPGVGNYQQVPEVLKKLNVKSVTLAYDMDMFTANNKDVSNDLMELADLLCDLGVKVKIAVWNGNEGKGLDDILVSDKCYIAVQDYEKGKQ